MQTYNTRYKKSLATFFVFLFSTQSIAQNSDLSYEEQFSIGGDTNFARTKDADTADINADGWPDILDANSNNLTNNTQLTIRFNNQGAGFNAESVIEGPDNVTSYDADLVDLNRDGYPDLIRTESVRGGGRSAKISVYRNLQGDGAFGQNWFDLSTPSDTANLNECPDDIDFADLNNDGWTDFVVARRNFSCVLNNRSSGVSVYLNTSSENENGDISFELLADLPAVSPNASIHDVMIVKGNVDEFPDIIALNERGANEYYFNSGGTSPSFSLLAGSNVGTNSTSGAVADFNLDGIDDIVVVDNSARTINIITQRFVPNGFTVFRGFATNTIQTIPTPEFSTIYDIEVGDFDLNGLPDILINGFSNNSVPATLLLVKEPNFSASLSIPSFRRVATTLLPNQPNSDFLSGDAIDYDLDGDLDIYIAGGDGGSPNGCFGCVQNRLYKNTISHRLNGSLNTSYNNFENGLGSWSQAQFGFNGLDSHDWSLNSGATPSSGTGPSRAKSGSSYLYLETSASGANTNGNTAFLLSPVIPSNNRTMVLSFDYHMFGSDIGSLHVDLIRPSSSTSSLAGEVLVEDIFVIDGAQQLGSIDAWQTATVDLRPSVNASFSAFESPRYMVRIRAVADGGFRGDIAIDNLIIKTNPFAISQSLR